MYYYILFVFGILRNATKLIVLISVSLLNHKSIFLTNQYLSFIESLFAYFHTRGFIIDLTQARML